MLQPSRATLVSRGSLRPPSQHSRATSVDSFCHYSSPPIPIGHRRSYPNLRCTASVLYASRIPTVCPGELRSRPALQLVQHSCKSKTHAVGAVGRHNDGRWRRHGACGQSSPCAQSDSPALIHSLNRDSERVCPVPTPGPSSRHPPESCCTRQCTQRLRIRTSPGRVRAPNAQR